ncbi:hypothetical protein SAMN02910298_02519 [Pseudobutyrivibrio sp. YE44]|nr:hypothetical protein SAMN02910298_02519 [Pseudobutyrivibrio sp. YE44]
MKMTDAFEHQSFYNYKENFITIDCRDIEGTRCYLDDLAKEEIQKRIYEFSPTGIHFIDSGNYHYLSLLWLQKVKEDFSLVLFDHHPDDQPPSFGQITSCGGWVLEAKETLPNLKKVFTYGVGEEIPVEDIPMDLPLYISIDKDVLSTECSVTDWDQGNMTLEELLDSLKILFKNHRIIGVDICGDSGENAESGGKINNQTNAALFDFLSENF